MITELYRYYYNVAKLVTSVKDSLKWANAKTVKDQVDQAILNLLGPKTEQDNLNKKKKAPAVAKETSAATANENKGGKAVSANRNADAAGDRNFDAGVVASFHKVSAVLY